MVIEIKNKKVKKKAEGLKLEKIEGCPSCLTRVGFNKCTINRVIDCSKLPKYKRPWRYDFNKTKVYYSGIYQRYYCHKCKKSFHDQFLGYEGKQKMPFLSKRNIAQLERIQENFEKGNVKEAMKYWRHLSRNKRLTAGGGSVYASLSLKLSAVHAGLMIKQAKELGEDQNRTLKENWVRQALLSTWMQLYYIYPFENRLLKNVSLLSARLDNAATENLEIPEEIKHKLEKEAILLQPPSTKTFWKLDKLLKTDPDDTDLMYKKLSVMLKLGMVDELCDELEHGISRKIYGYHFFKGFKILMTMDAKGRVDFNSASSHFQKSIYDGEKVIDSIAYLMTLCLNGKMYRAGAGIFTRLLKDLNRKIKPAISEREVSEFAGSEQKKIKNAYLKSLESSIRKNALICLLNNYIAARIYYRSRLAIGSPGLDDKFLMLNSEIAKLLTPYWDNKKDADIAYLCLASLYVMGDYDIFLLFYRRHRLARHIPEITKRHNINWLYFMLGHAYLAQRKYRNAGRYFNAIISFDYYLLEFAKALTASEKNKSPKPLLKLAEKLGLEKGDKNIMLLFWLRNILAIKYSFSKNGDDVIEALHKVTAVPPHEIYEKETGSYETFLFLHPDLFLEIYGSLMSFVYKKDVGIKYLLQLDEFMLGMKQEKKESIKNTAIMLCHEIGNETCSTNIAAISADTLAFAWNKPFDGFEVLLHSLGRYPNNKLLRRIWKKIEGYCEKHNATLDKRYLKYQEKINSATRNSMH